MRQPQLSGFQQRYYTGGTKVPKQISHSQTMVSMFHSGPRFENKYLKYWFPGSTLDRPQPAWHGWGEDRQRDRWVFQVFIVFLYVRYRPRPTQFLCEGTNWSTRGTRGWEQGWLNFYWTTQVDLFSRLPAVLIHISVIWCAGFSQTVIPVLSIMSCILKW